MYGICTLSAVICIPEGGGGGGGGGGGACVLWNSSYSLE